MLRSPGRSMALVACSLAALFLTAFASHRFVAAQQTLPFEANFHSHLPLIDRDSTSRCASQTAGTPTVLPTFSPTAAPTPTVTPTPSPTSTPVATRTPSATPTATDTETPSSTPTPTPTSTPTKTPSSTPTFTPTSTPTATPCEPFCDPGSPDIPGIWCWFGNPRAVHYVGEHDRTYWGVVDHLGAIVVYAYDHDSHTLQSAVLHEGLDANDHASPSLLVRPDGRLLLFYSAHNGQAVHERLSTRPEDVSAWGPEIDLDPALGGDSYTYPSPVQLTSESNAPIYLFLRGGSLDSTTASWRDYIFSTSADGGLNWSPARRLFVNPGQRPYVQFAQNGGDRIDFAVTDGHPNESATNSVYHFFYEGGQYHRSDGTVIEGGPPFAPSQGTQIWDGSVVKAWVWDLAIDAAGRPVLAYAVFPTTSDHRYHVARWTGTGWQDSEVAAAGGPLYAGEAYYSGGIALDRADLNTVYLSTETERQWQLWEYHTEDGGESWQPVQALSEASPWMSARPLSPLNSHEELTVLWWYGRYDTFKLYLTGVRSFPQVLSGAE